MSNLKNDVIAELTKYYETFDKASAEYIRNFFEVESEEKKNWLLKSVKETHPKKFGFPDISVLAKVYRSAPVFTQVKTHAECICNDCGTVYAYELMNCPKCHSFAHSVKVREV